MITDQRLHELAAKTSEAAKRIKGEGCYSCGDEHQQISNWMIELIARRNGETPVYQDMLSMPLEDGCRHALECAFEAASPEAAREHLELYYILFELLAKRARQAASDQKRYEAMAKMIREIGR